MGRQTLAGPGCYGSHPSAARCGSNANYVLDQYALSLQKAVSRMIDNCLGPCMYPAEEVAAGVLGPRVRRAAVQMEGMGLWRPSMDPLRLH